MSHLRLRMHLLTIVVCALFIGASLVTSHQTVTAQSAKGRSRIAFVTADYATRTMTISLADPASGKSIPLINDGYFFFPMLSPDGRHLAFLGEHPKEGIQNLYMIDADGSNLRRFIKGRPTLKPFGQIAWSPDSTQIIYGVLDRNRQPAGFFRANLDGGDPQEIVFDGIKRFDSTWITSSPDGKRVAVRANLNDAPYHQIYIADADGTNAKPVTATMPDGQPFDELVWSPDNQKTLLNVLMGNAAQPQPLMLGDLNGLSTKTLIKSPPNYINSVAWSPDGSHIAFLAPETRGSKPDGELWVANANGSGLRPLNISVNVAYVGTSWSSIPDDVVLPSTPVSFSSVSE